MTASFALSEQTDARRLGAYYTSDALAQVLTGWALRNRPGRVLDPSFGGCSFLRAALVELLRMDAQDAGGLVYGIDVDKRAATYADELFALGVPRTNILLQDFFETMPSQVDGGLFDAVVGNPPYVRHHWFRGRSRELARQIVEESGLELTARASAWAYFLVHSVEFLKPGGRLAQLLPGAILQADYAPALLRFLESQFSTLRLIRIRQRQFDAQEETVVLLGAGHGGVSEVSTMFSKVRDIEELRVLLNDGEPHSVPFVSSWRRSMLTEEQLEVWDAYTSLEGVVPLSDLARIRIGIVTGANEFFLRTMSDARALRGGCARVVRTVPKQRWLKGLDWSTRDISGVDRSGARSRLIVIKKRFEDEQVRRIVMEAEEASVHHRHKCRVRKPWYVLEDTLRPDAFLPYMSALAPRITLNSARSACLNSIHRLWWKPKRAPVWAIAIGSLTSAFVLGTELFGRSYGGGVLKLEIGDAKRLLIPVVGAASRERTQIDRALRKGHVETARRIADEVVLMKGLRMTEEQVAAIRSAAASLSQSRRGSG